MKSKWEYEFWDNYYDNCANRWRPDLNSSDPEKREMAEYMVKAMEDAKLYEHTAVTDPFVKGHMMVIKHKRGESPWNKEWFQKLSWFDKICWKIRNLF